VAQGLTPNYLDKIFTPLFEKYKVSVVFAGHMHNYQRRIDNGITYIVTGGGGAPLYDLQPGNVPAIASAKTYHAIDITINGSTLSAVVKTPGGQQIDAFTQALP
jgi:acid phosphatase type 7